jgi:hypothetical protein
MESNRFERDTARAMSLFNRLSELFVSGSDNSAWAALAAQQALIGR